MGELFCFQYRVGTRVPSVDYVRLNNWGEQLVDDLRRSIWDDYKAAFEKFDGIVVDGDLELWFHDESKPEKSRLLGFKEKLGVVFEGTAEKEVHVTPAKAGKWDVAFTVRGTSVPRGPSVPGDTLEVVRKMWDRLRKLSVDDYAAGKVVEVCEWSKRRGFNFPPRTGMYIRDSFSETFDDLMYFFESEGGQLLHLSGIPGIGKSTYIWYVLIRLAAHETYKRWTSVVVLSGLYYVFLPDGGVKICTNSNWDLEIRDIMSEDDCWTPVDQKHVENEPLGYRNIIFVSPDERNVKWAKKQGLAWATMYFKPWTLEDFMKVAKVNDQERERERSGAEKARNQSVGGLEALWGVPRVLFEHVPLKETKKMLQPKVANVKFAVVENMIGSELELYKVPFCLFKFEVKKKSRSREITIHFASDRIAYCYFEAAMQASRARVVQFLIASSAMTEKAAMRGFIFEQYGVSWLTGTDIKLSVRMLEDSRSRSRSVTLKLAKRELKVYENVQEMIDMGADAYKYLWRPWQPDNAGFDLLVPPRYLVQFTISPEKHSIDYPGMKLGVEALREVEGKVAGKARMPESDRCTKRFIFLGPPDTEGFGAQPLVTKKKVMKCITPIVRNVKQHHGVVILSNSSSREATGPYDEDEENIEPISGGGELGDDDVAQELGDDDEEEEVPATLSEKALHLKLEVVRESERKLAGLKRRRFFD